MKQKILVIEDNPEVRENTVELLELSGYEVLQAPHGKAGVKLALAEKPHLILCDIMMPEMDGYEVLHILGKNPQTASTPFIFLTAKSEKGDFRKGMNLGADDYITKPFGERELLESVERRLERFSKLTAAQHLEDFVKSAEAYPGYEQLTRDLQERDYRKGEILFRQGDNPNYALRIISGRIKIFQLNEDGKELIQEICGPGSFLGEKELISDKSHQQFAEALEPVTVGLIPKKLFNDLLFGNREVSNQFVKLLAQNLIEKEQKLVDMAYNTVRKRTAEALVSLHDTYAGQEGFKVARADLASIVGTATESVIRILSEFKRDGFVEVKGSYIKINDRAALEQIPS